MSAVSLQHLDALYAETDDPWDFRRSRYEAERFEAVVRALPGSRFDHALELGCGNGELARRISPRCTAYTGVDAVETALESARAVVPEGTFIKAYLPCRLPQGSFDLMILSEILYFLDPDGLTELAQQIDERWPRADLLCVTYRGPSGNLLEGEAALALFLASLDRRRRVESRLLDPAFRIDTAAAVAETVAAW